MADFDCGTFNSIRLHACVVVFMSQEEQGDTYHALYVEYQDLKVSLAAAKESLELMATSTQFVEGEYGYQFILLSKEALSKMTKTESPEPSPSVVSESPDENT